MKYKVNFLIGIIAALASTGSIGKPFPNTVTKVLHDRPGTFPRTTYVIVQLEDAVPQIRAGASITYKLGDETTNGELSGEPGKIGFVIADEKLGELKAHLDHRTLKVTLNIPVSVTYLNVSKNVVAEEPSAIETAKDLTVELEYPVPHLSAVSSVSYKIDGKEYQTSAKDVAKYQIKIGVPTSVVESIRKNKSLSLEIHNDEF
jgi:hypothetical protein